MISPEREYFVKDGIVMENWQFDPSWTKGRKAVYEVIRVTGGSLLFASEHVDRLMQSILRLGISGSQEPERILLDITKLMEANSKDDGNIMIYITEKNGKVHMLSCYIAHSYPGPDDYKDGVTVKTIRAIRKIPNAKRWNAELRSKASYIISSSNVYEVLLVDRKKRLTEGSRSNIFLVRGNSLFTPPEKDILQGITRQKVLDICEELLIRVSETDIPLSDLPFYEAAFLSGTSPGVLPIKMIDSIRFNASNDIMLKIMQAYQELVKRHVAGQS